MFNFLFVCILLLFMGVARTSSFVVVVTRNFVGGRCLNVVLYFFGGGKCF